MPRLRPQLASARPLPVLPLDVGDMHLQDCIYQSTLQGRCLPWLPPALENDSLQYKDLQWITYINQLISCSHNLERHSSLQAMESVPPLVES